MKEESFHDTLKRLIHEYVLLTYKHTKKYPSDEVRRQALLKFYSCLEHNFQTEYENYFLPFELLLGFPFDGLGEMGQEYPKVIFDFLIALLQHKDKFLSWMNHPNKALGNRTPLSLLSSRFGAEAVLDELGRIEYGVFS